MATIQRLRSDYVDVGNRIRKDPNPRPLRSLPLHAVPPSGLGPNVSVIENTKLVASSKNKYNTIGKRLQLNTFQNRREMRPLKY